MPTIRTKLSSLIGVAVILLVAAGCRGTVSDKPPVHPVLNMDFQEKFEAQEKNDFFADGRAMRTPVAGTVARGFLREDTEFYTGRHENGALVAKNPLPVTPELLSRGQHRFNIYCSPCHGEAGDGQGIISTGGYGLVPATSYHDDRLRSIEDGHFFDVITHGIRTMQPYGYQIKPHDRWAIVAYIRALQRSQNAAASDVPAEVKEELNN
jgi:mono/diheme cytochrome c family protein